MKEVSFKFVIPSCRRVFEDTKMKTVRTTLTALFLCLTILCGIVETASGAAAGFGQKTASGPPESIPDIYTYELGSLGQEPCWFDEVIHYDPATGVLYYVRQNPWSKFDPTGLTLQQVGSVYVMINHHIGEFYVGETGDEPDVRMNHSQHRASKLRNVEGTIAYSRTVEAEPDPDISAKFQRMVVERDVHEEIQRRYPDYKSQNYVHDSGEDVFINEHNYRNAKKTNPQMKRGERPKMYQVGKRAGLLRRGNRKFGEVSSIDPFDNGRTSIDGRKGAGLLVLGTALMFMNGDAEAEDFVQMIEMWRQSALSSGQEPTVGFEVMMAGKLTQQENLTNNSPAVIELQKKRKELFEAQFDRNDDDEDKNE